MPSRPPGLSRLSRPVALPAKLSRLAWFARSGAALVDSELRLVCSGGGVGWGQAGSTAWFLCSGE